MAKPSGIFVRAVPPLAALVAGGLVLSACTGANLGVGGDDKEPVSEHISNVTKFSQKEFQVAASPRVTAVKRPRKGGGRYQVGKPYQVRGKWYKPAEDASLKQTGLASWYGPNFHGRLTANGEIYDQYSLSAAHPTMPLPSYAKVTNLENGNQVIVRVNDRGPFAHGRVIDLSSKAADLLDFKKKGVAKVKVEYAGKARMDGLDEAMLLASYRGPHGKAVAPQDVGSSSGTMIAMADPVAPAVPVSGAAAAIESGFDQGGFALASAIPVPMERPTLFEGIPLDDGMIAYRGTVPANDPVVAPVKPLAFAEIEALDDPFSAYFGEAPDHEVMLVLGMPADLEARVLMRRVFADFGVITRDEQTGAAQLALREDQANQALALARQIGLTTAYLR
ncbi:MAG: septal ring lytic transglycosylase RlpA family protein [Nitratireductor sp.]|nr:septal ring lytic transglycosylase RlpA family protein [Nitratireductor sp.]